MLKKNLAQLQAGKAGVLDCGHPESGTPFICRGGRCLCAPCAEADIRRDQGSAVADEWRLANAKFIPDERFGPDEPPSMAAADVAELIVVVPGAQLRQVQGAIDDALSGLTGMSRGRWTDGPPVYRDAAETKSCACSTTAQITRPGPTKPGPTMPTKPKAKPRALTPLQEKLAAEIDRKSPGLTGAARATAIFNAEVQHASSLRLDRRVAAEDAALKSSAAFSTALRQYRSAGKSDLEARKLALDTARRLSPEGVARQRAADGQAAANAAFSQYVAAGKPVAEARKLALATAQRVTANKPKPPTSTPPRSAA